MLIFSFVCEWILVQSFGIWSFSCLDRKLTPPDVAWTRNTSWINCAFLILKYSISNCFYVFNYPEYWAALNMYRDLGA